MKTPECKKYPCNCHNGPQNETQHTPTPWKIERDDDGIQRIVAQRYIAKIERWHKYGCGSQYQEIEDNLKAESEANADFIVRAVNEYASDKATIKVLSRLLEKMTGWTPKQIVEEIEQAEGGK